MSDRQKEPAGHLDLIIDAQAPAPANTISFNADGKVVGSLDLGVDPITFTGNADEAAIVFFDSFIRLYDERYKELQAQVDAVRNVPHESITYINGKQHLRITREVVMYDQLLVALQEKDDGC